MSHSFYICHNILEDSFFFRAFQPDSENQCHLSVGALLFDDDGRIACHHFTASESLGTGDIYILMRKTIKDYESILDAVERGLAQEFGAIGEVKGFWGPYWVYCLNLMKKQLCM